MSILKLSRVRADHSLSYQEAWSFDDAKDLDNWKMKILESRTTA